MTPELSTRSKEAGIASLAVESTAQVEVERTKRLIHYIWFPFVDIPLLGPDGLRMRLGKGSAYYGMGRPGEDFGAPIGNRSDKTPWAKPRPANAKPAETADQYNERAAGFLIRCDAYPIWNINYLESRFNHGNFTDKEWNAGNTLNADVEAEDVVIPAGVCAADFVQRYEVTHGARVLTPLIGMDEAEMRTAQELVRLVQPKPHKLTNYQQEVDDGTVTDEDTLIFDLADKGPAHDRIMAAKLDKTLGPKAHELRRIMLSGVRQALVQARTDWESLLYQLSNSAMGQKGFKKHVSPYDRQVAWLLGMTPPANVAAKPSADPELRQAVQLLTQVVAGGQLPVQAGDTITVNAGELRRMIEAAVDQRLAAGKKGAKKPGEEGANTQ